MVGSMANMCAQAHRHHHQISWHCVPCTNRRGRECPSPLNTQTRQNNAPQHNTQCRHTTGVLQVSSAHEQTAALHVQLQGVQAATTATLDKALQRMEAEIGMDADLNEEELERTQVSFHSTTKPAVHC